MRNFLLLIKIWFKRKFGIRMSTKENAEYLERQKWTFFSNMTGWLQGLNEYDRGYNASEYSTVKNRHYYYNSTTVGKTEDQNIVSFDISGLKLKVLADLNPIAERVTYKTYKYVVDINADNGGEFVEMPALKIIFTATPTQNVWRFKNEDIVNKVAILAQYFDAIIDHFKEVDNE